MGKFTYHGLQTSIEGAASPTSIVTGANLTKASKQPPKKSPKPPPSTRKKTYPPVK